MKSKFEQLHQQIFFAAQVGESATVLGYLHLDYDNSDHTLAKEGNDLFAVIEAANMRHLPNQTPTWRSYGLHMVYKCTNSNCTCQSF